MKITLVVKDGLFNNGARIIGYPQAKTNKNNNFVPYLAQYM